MHHYSVEPRKLPGLGKVPDDLAIVDAEAFLENVPALANQLRMRVPAKAWALNLSPGSLEE
jgi:hypothetical protein